MFELTTRRKKVISGLIALVLIPVAPAGVPVLAASLAALVGLHSSARDAAAARSRTASARAAADAPAEAR